MTSNMPSLAAPGWFERLPSFARLLLIGVTVLLTVFSLGVVIGVVAKATELGELRPRGALALVIAGLVGVAGGWLSWRLSAHWRRPGRSGYEKRYTRMWLTIVALGFPLGLLLGVTNGPGVASLAGTGPIAPGLAIATAAALVLSLGASLILYHRAIDDHEQQAYLWANSLAFYFLVIAIPAAWLLSRGGVIAPLGGGSVMLILLGSMLINLVGWAVLKFR